MNDFDLDTLLEQHFHTPSTDRLNLLEQDVWRRIRLQEAKPTFSDRLQDWLAVLWIPQYRYAPVVMAIVIGLSAGSLSNGFIPHQSSATTTDILSLNVFSAEYSQFPSNLIKEDL